MTCPANAHFGGTLFAYEHAMRFPGASEHGQTRTIGTARQAGKTNCQRRCDHRSAKERHP